MSEHTYKQLISGEMTGVLAVVARRVLRVLSCPYSLIMWLRNLAFDIGLKKIHSAGVPVIAIGNLTTGGTGKTPIVATVVAMLQAQNHRPGIVSRGYRADDSGENDEKRVLEHLCPNVPHVQNPNRVVAAENLLMEQPDVDVIVLDDAFQHRRIHRDLNIVLVDATNPFGFGYQLPRGLLRESLQGLSRADMILITRSDSVSLAELNQIETTIRKYNPELSEHIHRVRFQPTALLLKSGKQQPLASIDDQPVTIMTAIGNPAAFLSTCRQIGANVVTSMFFADHHHYSAADLSQVQEHASGAGTPQILTTLKDLVKIPQDHDNILAVQIEAVFESEHSAESVRTQLAAATTVDGA